MTGQIVGTMAYLSADRIAGRPASVADDLYAVGVVGYEALAGCRPFPQENLAELARAIADGLRPPLALVRPGIEPPLAAVVERAMSRDPQLRFGSATSMRAALAGRAEAPVVTRPPTRVMAAPLPPPSTVLVAPPVRPNRTKKFLALGVVLAAIVLAAVLVIFDSGTQPPTPEPVSTSTPVPTPTSIVPPPPPPVPVVEDDQGGPRGNGNANGHKKKGPKGGD
jgi:serine/threonine protein kinase